MLRAFQVYKITTTNKPQPCFGTTLSASVVPAQNNPDGTPQPQSIPVADSSMFQQGDRIIFDYGQTTSEFSTVYSVPDSTHIKARIGQSHTVFSTGPGGYVTLAFMCSAITVQGVDGSAGDYFFGIGPSFNDTVTAGNGSGLFFIARKATSGNQPPFMQTYLIYGANAVNTDQIWIQGTANDLFIPSILAP